MARFRLPVWIAGISHHEETVQRLQFSFGVFPVLGPDPLDNWQKYVDEWLQSHGVEGDLVILTEGPSARYPQKNQRMEIIDLRRYRLS